MSRFDPENLTPKKRPGPPEGAGPLYLVLRYVLLRELVLQNEKRAPIRHDHAPK
jgi:hypothetical protein